MPALPKHICRGLCCALLFVCSGAMALSNNNVRFKHYGLNDGLSQTAVYAIAQDQTGFIWFATQEGLNRFDGYQFRHFFHDPDQTDSLSHDAVYTMLSDSQGNVWVAAEDGTLNLYQPETESFQRFRHNSRINTLYEDEKGQLWVGDENNGLNLFEPVEGRFKTIVTHSNHTLKNVRAIVQDASQRLWVGSDSGLQVLDLTTERFLKADILSMAPDWLASASVRTLMFDQQKNLWIGTYEHGLVRRDKNGFYQAFAHSSEAGSLCSNNIRDIRQNSAGQVWIATDNGLCLWQPDSQSFTAFRHASSDRYSLVDNIAFSLFEDRSGVMWVGTFGGISRWQGSGFQHYYHREGDANSLSSNVITAFAEGESGKLWIGTYDGLNLMDLQTGKVQRFTQDTQDSGPRLPDNRVMSLWQDKQLQLWIGTRSKGLVRYDITTGKNQYYSTEQGKLSGNGVTRIYEDHEERIWVASYGGGLDLYQPDTDSFINLAEMNFSRELSSQRILSLMQTQDGLLWVGTEGGGINSINLATKEIMQYRHDSAVKDSLSSDLAWTIEEDKFGNLWVGTWGAGLNKWSWQDREQGRVNFQHIGKKQGLISSVIYSVVPDEQGDIWITTNRGLTRLNQGLTQIRHFDESHGLQGNDFNHAAGFRASNGQLFFGGSDGFNSLFTGQLQQNLIAPQIAITRVMKMNKAMDTHNLFSDDNGLQLNYKDTFVSFEFAALDFAAPEMNQYRYTLSGFNDDWIDMGHTRQITFSHLPAGEYLLQIQAANNDGVWNEQGLTISLAKSPPPWLTPWAYAIYFALAAAAFALYLRSHQQKLREKAAYSRELEKTVKLRTQELLQANHKLEDAMEQAEAGNRSKGAFIATMSHEFRTPMTSIIGFAESLQEDVVSESEQSRRLTKIRANGEHLLQLLNKVLDVSKIEMNKLEVEAIGLSPVTLLQEVSDLLEQQCQSKNLKFTLDYRSPIPAEINSDPTRLKQILLNLCGNSIKFTASGEIRILVSADKAKNCMQFAVEDTGIGIPQDKLSSIFESFSQVDSSTTRKYGGTGLGLSISKQLACLLGGDLSVNSEEGKGSCFTLTISMGEKLPTLWLKDLAAIEHVAQRCPSQSFSVPVLSGRILLAEDWQDNQELISMYIKRTGAEVQLAEDGQQALEMGLSDSWDLILMDVQMPLLDGVDATSMLRASGFSGPIIALTANVSASDIENYLHNGFDGHLCKPIERNAFYQCLVSYLPTSKNGAKQTEQSDSESEQRLSEQFLQRLPELLDCINLAFKQQSWSQLGDLLHNLKGMGGSFGFPQITHQVVGLELHLQENDSESLARGLKDLQTLVSELSVQAPANTKPEVDGPSVNLVNRSLVH